MMLMVGMSACAAVDERGRLDALIASEAVSLCLDVLEYESSRSSDKFQAFAYLQKACEMNEVSLIDLLYYGGAGGFLNNAVMGYFKARDCAAASDAE